MTPSQKKALREDFHLWSGGRDPKDCATQTIQRFLETSYAWFVHYEPVPEDVTKAQVAELIYEWDRSGATAKADTQFYTDYPFVELGDEPGKKAPIREVSLIGFDGDKYVDVLVEGKVSSTKYGYIYMEPKRCGETPCVSHADIRFVVCGGGQP
jgi:hypothetical protein